MSQENYRLPVAWTLDATAKHFITPLRDPHMSFPLPISQMRKQNLQSDTGSKGQNWSSNPDMSKVGLHGFLLAGGCHRHTRVQVQLFPYGVYGLLVPDNWNEAREHLLCRQVHQGLGGGKGESHSTEGWRWGVGGGMPVSPVKFLCLF